MNYMKLGQDGPSVSAIALGCMNFAGHWNGSDDGTDLKKRAGEAFEAALEAGITLFDHADLYRRGESERMFGKLLANSGTDRGKVVLQSKCGIFWEDDKGPTRIDTSREHILSSVRGSLERLRSEYLDVLLIHQPDPLMDPGETADALIELRESGRVRHFGVSNFHTCDIQLLQARLPFPLVANQVRLGVSHGTLFDESYSVNDRRAGHAGASLGLLQYAMMNGVTLQAWAPLEVCSTASDTFPELKRALKTLAENYDVPESAIATAWLLRHPAGIQPVIGSRTPSRIRAACRGCEVAITREEWWQLYIAGREKKILG